MSSAQSETFSPHNIAVLGGLLLLALILGEVVFNPHNDAAMAKPADTMEDIAMRLQPVVSLDNMRNSVNAASAAGDTASKSPDELYQAPVWPVILPALPVRRKLAMRVHGASVFPKDWKHWFHRQSTALALCRHVVVRSIAMNRCKLLSNTCLLNQSDIDLVGVIPV